MAFFDFLNQANPRGRDAGSIARQRLDARTAFKPPIAAPGPTPGIPTSTAANAVGLQGLLYANQQLQPLLRSLNIGYDVTKDPRVQAANQIGKNYKVGGIEYDMRTGRPVNPPASTFVPAKQQPRTPATDKAGSGNPAAERAFDSEKSRIAQLTAQDPELQRYERAAALARKSGATEQDVQSAEDIGMAMWAKANPKLAAKVKPGQSGYEVIQNELNAGQMGPVTNFPFDTTRPLSPTPIPPEQRAVTYEGVKPVTLEGVTPIVGGGFPTEQAAMFERFQQSIAPNKPSFQGSPLGTATPLVGNLSYTGSITPIGTTAVQGGDFRSEQARKLAEMFKNAQFSS